MKQIDLSSGWSQILTSLTDELYLGETVFSDASNLFDASVAPDLQKKTINASNFNQLILSLYEIFT